MIEIFKNLVKMNVKVFPFLISYDLDEEIFAEVYH